MSSISCRANIRTKRCYSGKLIGAAQSRLSRSVSPILSSPRATWCTGMSAAVISRRVSFTSLARMSSRLTARLVSSGCRKFGQTSSFWWLGAQRQGPSASLKTFYSLSEKSLISKNSSSQREGQALREKMGRRLEGPRKSNWSNLTRSTAQLLSPRRTILWSSLRDSQKWEQIRMPSIPSIISSSHHRSSKEIAPPKVCPSSKSLKGSWRIPSPTTTAPLSSRRSCSCSQSSVRKTKSSKTERPLKMIHNLCSYRIWRRRIHSQILGLT